MRRRIWKWTRRIVLGLLALVVVVVGVALIVLHTDWGREQLRVRALAAVGKSFPGGISIGKIEGSVLGDLVVRDLEIRDAAGRPAIVGRRLRVNLGYRALLRGEIELETLDLDGGSIFVDLPAGQPPNLASAYVSTSDEPLTWDVALRRIRVRDVDITIDRDGTIEHLDDLAIDASASLRASGATDARLAITGIARERAGAPLAIDAEAHLDAAGAIAVPSARVSLGQLAVEVQQLAYVTKADVRGGLIVTVPEGELFRLAPELAAPRFGIALRADVAPVAGRADALALTLGGTVAAATLTGQLTATPLAERPRVDGTLGVKQVDLAAFGPGLPPSALAAELAIAVALDPAGTGLGLATGDVTLTGRGEVAEVVLDELRAGVKLAAGIATLDLHGQGPGGTVVAASAAVEMPDGAIVVRDGKVDATIASIVKATRGAVPVDGAVTAELRASARIAEVTQLDAHAAVRARGLRFEDLRIAEVRLDADAAGEPRAIAGQVRLSATNLRKGELQLPEISATVRGQVAGPIDIQLDANDGVRKAKAAIAARVILPPAGDPGPALVTVVLGDFRFDVPRAAITGTGGRITLEDERIVVKGLRMSGAGGSLAVDAIAGRGRRADQLEGQLALTGLDLSKLRGIPGVPRRLGGALAIRADVKRRGRALEGEVQASASKLVLTDGARPVDIAISTEIRPQRVEIAVNASGAELGKLTATMDVKPPRYLDDVAAWTKLDRRAIAAIQLDAEALDLARLAQLAGQEPMVEGTLDAKVALDELQTAVEIRGHRLIVAGAPAPIDLDLDIDLADPTTARIAAEASLIEIGRAKLTTGVALPSRPFDLQAWRNTDLRAVEAIELAVDEINLDDALARRLGLEGMRGKLSATVRTEPGLRALTVHVDAHDLIAGPLVEPASLKLDATVDEQGARADVTVGLGAAPVLAGQITAPVTIARVLAGQLDVGTLALEGKLQVADTPVATLTRALGQGRQLGGRVRGEATVSGTVSAPAGQLALIVTDLGARTPRGGGPVRGGIRELTVDARYQDGKAHAEIHGAEADGGKLAIIADVDPANLAGAHASIVSTGFQIGPLTRLAPTVLLGVRGLLDADLTIRGIDPATAKLAGVVRITGGQAPIADTVGNLRDASIELGFNGNEARLKIGGALESGRIDATGTATLRGLLPEVAQLDVAVRDVSLITSAAPRFAGKLRVDVKRNGAVWNADARIRDGEVNVPEEEGRELHPAGLPADLVFTSDLRPGVEVPRTAAASLRAWLGVRPTHPVLRATLIIDPVAVDAAQFRGEVSGRLELAVGDDGASVDGRIAVDRGNVVLFERRYGIRLAALQFDGSIDPLLDIQLEYDFPQLSMRAQLGGRLSKPTLTLSSNPNTYTEGQLLALLLGGSPGSVGGETAAAATGVAAALTSEFVGGLFSRALPVRVDVLNYEPSTASSSGAFVVGRWITSKLLLLLRTRIEARPDENVSEAEVEYWLSPRVLLEGTAGDRSVLGVDLLWNRRW